MVIKRIQVSNFKSFKELDIELGSLNILIGANAAGKSNFVRILRFLRDIINHGLDNAISMQGGATYLRSLSAPSSEELRLKVVVDQILDPDGLDSDFVGTTKDGLLLGWGAYEITYTLSIRFGKRGTAYQVVEDKYLNKCVFSQWKEEGEDFEKLGELGRGSVILRRARGRTSMRISLPKGGPIRKADIRVSRPETGVSRRGAGHLRGPLLETRHTSLRALLYTASIYDFDPKLAQKAVPITGMADLEEDGSNLALALQRVIHNRDGRRKLLNLLSDLLPFVDGMGMEKLTDKSLLFTLRESFHKRRSVPAPFVSDGTIDVLALILALYFQRNPLVVIEEPERNLHPHLISRLVTMMKDASQGRQIIVTTHNPEIVRNADPHSVLLVSRDREGFSHIRRPAEVAEVRTFLKNDIGMEELYVQGVLESLA